MVLRCHVVVVERPCTSQPEDERAGRALRSISGQADAAEGCQAVSTTLRLPCEAASLACNPSASSSSPPPSSLTSLHLSILFSPLYVSLRPSQHLLDLPPVPLPSPRRHSCPTNQGHPLPRSSALSLGGGQRFHGFVETHLAAVARYPILTDPAACPFASPLAPWPSLARRRSARSSSSPT